MILQISVPFLKTFYRKTLNLIKMAASMKMVLFSWGSNCHGQLCAGHKQDLFVPTEIQDDFLANVNVGEIKQIVGGGSHVVVLTNNGLVYTCGQNSRGQLGQTDTSSEDVNILKQVTTIKGNVIKVACGWEHTLCVTDDGKVFGWGANNYKQLGLPDILHFTSKPQEIKVNGSKVVDIAAGLRHSLALTEDGNVFVWGSGRRGQLGITYNKEPITELSEPKQISAINSLKIVSIACGSHHSLALTENGSVYGWGCNRRGVLTSNTETYSESHEPIKLSFPNDNRIKCLTSGWSHVIAITDSNEILTWGRNDYGQLGRDGVPHVPSLVANLNLLKIIAGSEHNLAINVSNSVVSWGWNEHGICGTGNEDNVTVPQIIDCFKGYSVTLIGTGYGTSYAIGHKIP